MRINSVLACTFAAIASLGMAGLSAVGQGQQNPNSFAPTYAPDREYDLLHLKVVLDVNETNRTFSGESSPHSTCCLHIMQMSETEDR